LRRELDLVVVDLAPAAARGIGLGHHQQRRKAALLEGFHGRQSKVAAAEEDDAKVSQVAFRLGTTLLESRAWRPRVADAIMQGKP
jgi:hypothetical protein